MPYSPPLSPIVCATRRGVRSASIVAIRPSRTNCSDSCSGQLCFFFCLPWTVNQREHLLAQGLVVIEVVPSGHPYSGHVSEQAIVRGPAAQHPPEALNDIALRTITRQPFHPQLRMGRSHLFHQGPTMP